MLNNLKPESWEYIVRCKKEQSKELFIKSVGAFSTPYKAMTFVSENGRDWEFFGNFEVCNKNKTARSSFLEMWLRKTRKRGV